MKKRKDNLDVRKIIKDCLREGSNFNYRGLEFKTVIVKNNLKDYTFTRTELTMYGFTTYAAIELIDPEVIRLRSTDDVICPVNKEKDVVEGLTRMVKDVFLLDFPKVIYYRSPIRFRDYLKEMGWKEEIDLGGKFVEILYIYEKEKEK